jgi:hypothetical protein
MSAACCSPRYLLRQMRHHSEQRAGCGGHVERQPHHQRQEKGYGNATTGAAKRYRTGKRLNGLTRLLARIPRLRSSSIITASRSTARRRRR